MKSETDSYGYTTSAVSSPVNQWTYAYEDENWKDKLTKFNGATITYDAIGNPLSDGIWTYTWEKGRQLKSMHNASTGVTMEFKYNHKGIRTQKIKRVNDVVEETTNYILSGKKIIAINKSENTLYFSYDAYGMPVSFTYNGNVYSYIKNGFSDIVCIIDSSGTVSVWYLYDAWGNLVTTIYNTAEADVICNLNPFGYKNYVRDAETGLYYLESRYYCSETQRFINRDVCITTKALLGLNFYSYTSNNPVNRKDHCGNYHGLAAEINTTNWFSSVIGLNSEQLSFLHIPQRVQNQLKEIDSKYMELSGKHFQVPRLTYYTMNPTSVEFIDYSQIDYINNVTQVTLGYAVQILGSEKVDEIIDYYLATKGVSYTIGETINKTAGIIDEIWGDKLRDPNNVRLHILTLKYNFGGAGNIYAYYVFSESLEGDSHVFNGVHVKYELRGIKRKTWEAYYD